ncbi:uncharacterized protein LOC111880257 [Lactuca sativa]|uniref:uncharacterized protein LOC111880257 n=1 Tax=Lactuca sativa TaxID=4236 RepID=UPI000CD84C8D|nr:uncharacterized protein LOC111880257 [Lactuca sativa]
MKPGTPGQGWISPFVVNAEFCVALLRDRIERADFPVCDGSFPWLKMLPLKVLGFVWRAKQNKIASSDALQKRGILLESSLCGACREAEETGDHLLVACPLVKVIYPSIYNWCNIQVTEFQSVNNMIEFASKWGNCPKKRKMLTTILFGTLWCIWRARNDRIFNKAQ